MVSVYYSQDYWTTWNYHDEWVVSLIWTNPYVEFTTNHFTDFAILWSTWSFVINNDDATTTSQNVTLNIYISPSISGMRFSNDGITWSTWEPYAASTWRTLSWSYGNKTVYAQFDIDGDEVSDVQTSDEIEYTDGSSWGWWCGALGNGEACITLGVTAGWFSCSLYPTAVDFGSTAAWSSDILLSDDERTDHFVCTDLLDERTTPMTAQSTDLTGSSIGLIDASNITRTPTASLIQIAGTCSDLSLWAGWTLNTAIELITKSWTNVCDFSWTPADEMTINVPAYSPVETYQAVMTITDPS